MRPVMGSYPRRRLRGAGALQKHWQALASFLASSRRSLRLSGSAQEPSGRKLLSTHRLSSSVASECGKGHVLLHPPRALKSGGHVHSGKTEASPGKG